MRISEESILDDLENDRLPLPTLPEVAIKVRETVDDDNVTISDVAQIIETDAALSARIIQVANSALYSGISSANTVHAAAIRMGLDTVRSLATSLVMKQLFQATHPVTDKYLRSAWKQSTDVASLSAIIAKTATTLEADSALLAGLTHSIGLSPILVKAEGAPELLNDIERLEELLYELYPRIGTQILRNWGFSEELVQVASQHLNIKRGGNNGQPDYVDVVQIALLQTSKGERHPLSGVDLMSVSAFQRINMGEVEEINMSGGVEEVDEIRAVFN